VLDRDWVEHAPVSCSSHGSDASARGKGRDRAKAVVDAVERELFTPYGLRSLSPADSRYRGRYEGDSIARDSSYHQGPVWAWLLGPFIDAYLKVHGDTGHAQVREWLQLFSAHLTQAGLGHVSEIFDGDPPYRPRGCFAQAWSVAEVLRAVVENGLAETAKPQKAAVVRVLKN